MAKIYLPNNLSNNACIVLEREGTFRVYESTPNGTQQSVAFTDYYVKNNYITYSGTSTFTQDTTLQCLDHDQFTTDYWYRPDIWQSLICFYIIALVGLYLPFKILSRMLGRWLKI